MLKFNNNGEVYRLPICVFQQKWIFVTFVEEFPVFLKIIQQKKILII
ncbi:hypothetical protein EYS08_24890 [Pedobacter kyonggii]|uniref:Uncharacterized protein n=1 Tax=Pedobacter kyonggii TaxID=1926871 RepID=A0A4Q9H6C2_9SPHI|nr:hypothetical protein EYS08_24890 [Pedobacter kyonggii]